MHDLIENVMKEGKTGLDAISMDISAAQLEQMDELRKLKDIEIENSNVLVNVTYQQRILESRVANAELANAELKATMNERKVAFSAYVKEDQITKHGDTIVFGGQPFGIGGGFDTSTGIFTCPKTGIYVFYVTLVCVANSKETNTLTASLKTDSRDKMNIVSSSIKHEYYGSEGSNMVIANLTQGQTVKVVTYGRNSSVMRYMSTFSGMLLYWPI